MTDKIGELIERLRDAAALPNGLYAEAAEALSALRAQRDEVIEECARVADKRAKAHEFSFARAVEFKHHEHQTRHAVAFREAEELAAAIRNLKSQEEPR